jgi:hypothetical protein
MDYLVVFIVVVCCELLLVIGLNRLVMKMSGVRLLSPAPPHKGFPDFRKPFFYGWRT